MTKNTTIMKLPKLFVILPLTLLAFLGAGCFRSDADVVSYNVSKSADQFEVNRRIVFYNVRTDTYMLSVEGLCSIGNDATQSEISFTCKTGKNEYKKHFLGLSRDVTYFVEQVDDAKASEYRYKVIFKPSVIVPDVDVSL